MADRRRPSAEEDVGDPHRVGGVADQGGFTDQYGTTETGGGLGEGGLVAEGVTSGAPSEASLMTNQRSRPVEDEAGYDELRDLRPGLTRDRPIVVDRDDER
jgi:hypothetical protein